MAFNGASSIFFNLMRIARLDANGAPLVGANNLYWTTAMIRLEFNLQYVEGSTISQTNGAGVTCFSYQPPTTVERLAIPRLSFCSPDPEALEMLIGGAIITGAAATNEVQTLGLGAASAGTITITFDGQTTGAINFDANAAAVQTALEALSNVAPGDIVVTGGPLPGAVTLTFGGAYAGVNVPQITVTPTGLTGGTVTIATTTQGAPATSIGYAAPAVGVDPTPNGVSIEAWSRQIIGGAAVGYYRWALPRVYLRTNDAMALASDNPVIADLTGFGIENPEWGDGPANDWTWTSDRVIQYVQVAALPTFTPGYGTVIADA